MALTFQIVESSTYLKPEGSPNLVILKSDNWDDYHFKTFFSLHLYDHAGKLCDLGTLRIGFIGQPHGWTLNNIEKSFTSLSDNFFSLGASLEYYTEIRDKLHPAVLANLLKSLRDIAYDTSIIPLIENEEVFQNSFLRSISVPVITGQYARVIRGGSILTSFDFTYTKSSSDLYSGITLSFKVDPTSKPSSNIHILIGRNGVGKTTLLNDMVKATLNFDSGNNTQGIFYDNEHSDIYGERRIIPANGGYFTGVISVSFSAFDPFLPPEDRTDRTRGICYNYVGLKDQQHQNGRHKNTLELTSEYLESLKTCLHIEPKRRLWEQAISALESDPNFAEMELLRVSYGEAGTQDRTPQIQLAEFLFSKMSSGHRIVLLTVTKLIEKVEEKTLILLDEPESHLHPPLLAAFMRALSNLLDSRNGIAIIATHSPVVLQEVPKSCVSILERYRLEMRVYTPEVETFAENVGILTREVFGLEVARSGFHSLLASEVALGKSLEMIIHEYGDQIGFEGRAIIQSLINRRPHSQ